jgi:hypothetical protein
MPSSHRRLIVVVVVYWTLGTVLSCVAEVSGSTALARAKHGLVIFPQAEPSLQA